METIFYRKMASPVGDLMIGVQGDGLRFIHFGDLDNDYRKRFGDIIESGDHPLVNVVISELNEYFDEKRKHFTVKPILKGTPFQVKVWQALVGIPYGMTASYKKIAKNIGNPKAVRAIGMANHNNLIPIIVPCHRVIYQDGSLGGFAGGVEIKRFLLELEKNDSY